MGAAGRRTASARSPSAQGGEVESAPARRHLSAELGRRAVVLRDAEGDDGAVGVELGRRGLAAFAESLVPSAQVLVGPGRRRRFGQDAAEGTSTLEARLAPDVFLHGLGRGDPRSAALAPAGGAGDGHLQAELVGQGRCVFERVLPPGSHVDEALGDDLRRLEARVEVLEPGDAGALHPLEVGLDARLGDVAAHPVPPDARLGACGRRLETPGERVVRALRGNDPRSQSDGDHGRNADRR